MENPKTTYLGYANLLLTAAGVVAIQAFQVPPETVTLVVGVINAMGLVAAKDGSR